MFRFLSSISLVWLLVGIPSVGAVAEDSPDAAIARDYEKHLGELFEHFHRNPELSFREKNTSRRLAKELDRAGADVTRGVGGTGVVGILENGDGPLVLVRADMDGLPLEEKTGLSYASVQTQIDTDGVRKPVMHACGHDVHMTALVGTARQLEERRDEWSGTVMFIGQPAEERIGGAKAMLEDGLYQRFGVPDYALALHVMAGGPAGKLALAGGATASSSDSVDITVRGIGTHGASPQKGKDPIYIASQIVIALQGFVGREINPLESGVITVGSFHGGFKHNVIPEEVKLLLTVRADSEATREQLLAGIERIALGVARTNGVPEELLPIVDLSVESTPAGYNDPALSKRIRAAFVRELGPEALFDLERDSMGAEDFAYFVRTEEKVPGAYFTVGGSPQTLLDAAADGGPPAPSHHSPFFQIDPEPAITGGVRGMTIAVLELLGKPTPSEQ